MSLPVGFSTSPPKEDDGARAMSARSPTRGFLLGCRRLELKEVGAAGIACDEEGRRESMCSVSMSRTSLPGELMSAGRDVGFRRQGVKLETLATTEMNRSGE